MANLRYRLEPRFAASDIELQWDVALLPPLTRLDANGMRQFQFMVFEALSNMLRVIDNGRGFDPDRVMRKGLASLRERAAAIGARLEISSTADSTVVEIALD